jgi:hypothetical protein
MKRIAEVIALGALSLASHACVGSAEAHPKPPAPSHPAAEADAAAKPPPWLCKQPMRAADFPSGAPPGKRARQRADEGTAGKASAPAALPSFVDAARARAWTEHPADSLEQVAARAWPGVADRWIVIAAGKSDLVQDGLDVRLALLEVTAVGGAPPTVKRVARTTEPLVARAQFGLLPEDFLPTTCGDGPCADGFPIERVEDVALDFAAYELAPGERAFGVRTTWMEGYGGGYGQFDSLSLFRADGDRLVPILEVPIGVDRLIAGDWNANGSRGHDTYQASLFLRMVPGAGGRSSVALAPRRGKPKLFDWDSARRVYRCRAR